MSEALLTLKELRRFFSHVQLAQDSDCWEWQSYKDAKGYGRFKFRGKAVWAHRFAFEAFRRALLPNEDVHHVCGNPSCVNPMHLTAMERQEHGAISKVKHSFLREGKPLFPLEELLEELDDERIPF